MSHPNEATDTQVQQDIENTRSQLDETLTAIEHRLAPKQLLEDGIDYLRHNGGREYLVNLRESVKREPIPLALVGVGLAWMMMTHSRGQGTGAATSTDRDASADASSATVREKATAAAAKVSDLAQGARDRASQAGNTVRGSVDRVRGGYDYLVNEQPLALGAIGFALGVILAAAAPRSNAEDQLVGDTSDRMKEDLGERGREQADRLASVAGAAVEHAQTSLKSAPSTSDPGAPVPGADPSAEAAGRPRSTPDAQP